MICRQATLRLLARAHAVGVKEELIGDLIEEISGGRSQLWVWRQLTALYGFAVIAHIRNNARLTPPMIALALCALLAAGALFGSAGDVIVAWLGFYYVAGTASLFAQMAASTANIPKQLFHGRRRPIGT